METIKKLDLCELAQVNGGDGSCLGIGVSDGGEAAICIKEGVAATDTDNGYGFNLCFILGIGIGNLDGPYYYKY